MMKFGALTRMRFLAGGLAGAALLSAAGEAKTPISAWTEVYSASPASYILPPDIPAQMKPLTIPKTAQGTLRSTFVISAGGDQLRIRISNEENDIALSIGSVTVGLADPANGKVIGSLRRVTFSGLKSIVVPAGAPVLSDPVKLSTNAFSRLAVSIFAPDGIPLTPLGGASFEVAPGDQSESATLRNAKPMGGRPLVTGVAVDAMRDARLIVTMGDSITDGVRPAPGTLASYPEVLARRLSNTKGGAEAIVVNAGIAGNQLLAKSFGQSALSRLDRDVLRLPGVSHIFLLEGINDIGMGGAPLTPSSPLVTADQLIAGYKQIVARAHARGVKVIVGTLMPFEGAFYYTPEKEKIRVAVNEWLRSTKEFDGLVDFDAIVRDPSNPTRLRKDVDSGDHLHPSDNGYRIMGNSIDLRLLR